MILQSPFSRRCTFDTPKPKISLNVQMSLAFALEEAERAMNGFHSPPASRYSPLPDGNSLVDSTQGTQSFPAERRYRPQEGYDPRDFLEYIIDLLFRGETGERETYRPVD